jgi:hypothetical protein
VAARACRLEGPMLLAEMQMGKQQEIAFRSEHATLTIGRPAERVVLVSLAGNDVGQFGDAPFKELAADLASDGQLELFIDARSGVAASLDVSGEWALWLAKNRASFRHVSMLTGSRFIQLSASLVRRFADLGDLMRIYADPAAFEGALSNSIANASSA